jgi:hypothetical protein
LRYSSSAAWLFSFALPAFLIRHARQPSTLEAGKIALQANPVNSGVHTCISVRRCGYELRAHARRDKSAGAINFLFSLGHARFLFLVKKIFSTIEKLNSFFSCRF